MEIVHLGRVARSIPSINVTPCPWPFSRKVNDPIASKVFGRIFNRGIFEHLYSFYLTNKIEKGRQQFSPLVFATVIPTRLASRQCM